MENIEKKPKDKFETFLKFTALGLAGVVASAAFLFKDNVVNYYDKSKVFPEVVASLKEEIKNGAGSLDGRVIKIKTGVDYQNVKNIWGSFASSDDVDDGLCALMLSAGGSLNEITKYGVTKYGVQEEYIENLNSTLDKENSKKLIELVGYHELYHCDEEVKLDERFNIKGYPELSSALNSLYKGSSLGYTRAVFSSETSRDTLLMNGNLDNLLSEGYAESASSIIMARKYGEDVIPSLSFLQAVRGFGRVPLSQNNPHTLFIHTTEAINNYYMSPAGKLAESKIIR